MVKTRFVKGCSFKLTPMGDTEYRHRFCGLGSNASNICKTSMESCPAFEVNLAAPCPLLEKCFNEEK